MLNPNLRLDSGQISNSRKKDIPIELAKTSSPIKILRKENAA